MEDTGESGQDAPTFRATREPPLAVVARAVAHLTAAGRLQVAAWSDAYAEMRPLGHPSAQRDAPDAGFLGAALGIGGAALLGAAEIVVGHSAPRALPVCRPLDDDRVALLLPPGPEARADGLALALGLQREADKLRHAIEQTPGAPLAVAAELAGQDPAALAAEVGVSEEELAAGLDALLGRATRTLAVGPPPPAALVDDVVLDVAAEGDALYVFAGATERLHDLVSPYARRLGAQLAQLAGGAGDDAAYDGLSVLFSQEPRAHDERLDVEAREGLTPCGRALVVRFDAVDVAAVDPRARDAVRSLKQRRACAVLCDRDPATLAAVLRKVGDRVRVVALLAEGITAGPRPWPDVVVDPTSGHPLELDNALTDAADDDDDVATFISPPSLGFTPVDLLQSGIGSAPLAYPLLYEAVAARARGELSRRARLALGTFAPGDPTTTTGVAVRCLERMAAAAPLPRRHQR